MSKSTLEFLGFTWFADRLVPFIRENHARWSAAPVDDLYGYLAWFWARDLLAVSSTDGEIYGLCTIKLFNRLEDFLLARPFEPTGKFCMVDLLVAVSPLAIADCLESLFRRWGPQEIMLWERGDRTEKSSRAPRMYTWAQYLRLTSRLTYGTVQEELYGIRR
jgi:hypothetical protein